MRVLGTRPKAAVLSTRQRAGAEMRSSAVNRHKRVLPVRWGGEKRVYAARLLAVPLFEASVTVAL